MCDDSQQQNKENVKQEVKQEQDEMLQLDPLDQHESTGQLTEQELLLDGDEGEIEGNEVVMAKHDDGLHGNWKQDERMVLEAGSKVAEIAKNVFGK